MMLTLIEQIRERLAQGAYANEAAISHGVVTPILNALGWDSADPHQLVPEFSLPGGRVDFALFGLGHTPAIFIEVKAVGRAVEGDRQLFEYAFHHGVQLCVLTDGREWSFYLPSGHGSYEDRRVYRLQLDERKPEDSEPILRKYLQRDRVRNQSVFEDAQREHRIAAGRREAVALLPRAWAELLAKPEDMLFEAVAERAEMMCGYRPDAAAVLSFLKTLKVTGKPTTVPDVVDAQHAQHAIPTAIANRPATKPAPTRPLLDRSASFVLQGKIHAFENASLALVELLRILGSRDASLIGTLADAVRTTSRNLIAHTPVEVAPGRPHLQRAAEFAPGWVVGLNIANRDKAKIMRAAADVYGLRIPEDLTIDLPNA